ncbi:hypothetical protein BC936DRAFT_144448 [Jimgerdemannia flammicorona]|uniref:Uncharacterized protein n=1 Tax=Jimgerdemannia flammicorona TaxID=994334 RepID=A0A432ZY25_9FUNG|nr:hypothetical protein BC936DRAFT_144448 [Jimgerdemannia flammicorona]
MSYLLFLLIARTLPSSEIRAKAGESGRGRQSLVLRPILRWTIKTCLQRRDQYQEERLAGRRLGSEQEAKICMGVDDRIKWLQAVNTIDDPEAIAGHRAASKRRAPPGGSRSKSSLRTAATPSI